MQSLNMGSPERENFLRLVTFVSAPSLTPQPQKRRQQKSEVLMGRLIRLPIAILVATMIWSRMAPWAFEDGGDTCGTGLTLIAVVGTILIIGWHPPKKLLQMVLG